MPVTDTIADMLARIRNAGMVKKPRLTMPSSKMLAAIAQILQDEGYIKSYNVAPTTPQSTLQIDLKYTKERHPQLVIKGLKRVSKPGRRVYTQKDAIPWVRSGLGIAILTTPQGVMTGRKARRLGVGGEILCYVW
ncbi:MAG: 30S ribosomal protein S8 [Saprospiraceae bacterium]